jgi:hypothetical protein
MATDQQKIVVEKIVVIFTAPGGWNMVGMRKH